MHDCGNMDNNNNNMVASFIMKTYHMVNDQTTDHLIGWGRANNTFVVIDPLEFSRLLLPTYFKHNNFSSFVRQLNTYSFKKVDPDRWEFANQWFLRGQKHLLKNVVRRKNGESHHRRVSGGDAAAEEVEREIERLKKEQSEMAGELKEMTRRLEATERRPEQTVAFLHKVVEDPEILTRVMSRRDFKKRRVVMAAEAAPEEWSSLNGLRSPSPEGFLRSCGGAGWFGGGGIEGVVCVNGAKGVATAEDGGDGVGFCDGGDGVGFCDGGVVALASDVEARPPPYPFSLFGGGI